MEIGRAVIDKLVRWTAKHDSIRAMLLYSSRTDPNAPLDVFSDHDLRLGVTDVRSFHEDDRSLEEFGPALVVLRNPIGLEHGFECLGFITHYEDGTKIDYGFFPAEFLPWAGAQPALPEDLDNGYVVLPDRDRLTDGLKPPSYRAYTPSPPSARDYRAVIDSANAGARKTLADRPTIRDRCAVTRLGSPNGSTKPKMVRWGARP